MEKQIIQCPSQVADEGGAVSSMYLSWSRRLLGVQVQARLHWHDLGKQVKTCEFSKAKAKVSKHARHTCKYRCKRVSRPPLHARLDTHTEDGNCLLGSASGGKLKCVSTCSGKVAQKVGQG